MAHELLEDRVFVMILGKCPNPVTQCDRKCSFCVSSKYKNILRVPEVAQQAKKCTAMPGDLCSVSGAHMVEGEKVGFPPHHTHMGRGKNGYE